MSLGVLIMLDIVLSAWVGRTPVKFVGPGHKVPRPTKNPAFCVFNYVHTYQNAMSNSDRTSRGYIAKIQAQNVIATVASGGRSSNDGDFSVMESTLLGQIQTTLDNSPKRLVSTDPSSNKVTLSWVDGVTLPVTSYRIEYSVYPYTSWTSVSVSYNSANPGYAVISGLTTRTTYKFKVYTLTASGASQSSSITVTTL